MTRRNGLSLTFLREKIMALPVEKLDDVKLDARRDAVRFLSYALSREVADQLLIAPRTPRLDRICRGLIYFYQQAPKSDRISREFLERFIQKELTLTSKKPLFKTRTPQPKKVTKSEKRRERKIVYRYNSLDPALATLAYTLRNPPYQRSIREIAQAVFPNQEIKTKQLDAVWDLLTSPAYQNSRRPAVKAIRPKKTVLAPLLLRNKRRR